jgi:hypothetical protein
MTVSEPLRTCRRAHPPPDLPPSRGEEEKGWPPSRGEEEKSWPPSRGEEKKGWHPSIDEAAPGFAVRGSLPLEGGGSGWGCAVSASVQANAGLSTSWRHS